MTSEKLKTTKFDTGSTYRIFNSQIKRIIKKAKEDWVNRKFKEIYNCFTHNNTKKAYKIVKDLTKPKQRTSTNIQNKEGNCINDKKGVIIRWTKYCSELYNANNDNDTSILNATETTDNENYPILRREVVAVIQSLKSGKLPGVDTITGELLKSGDEKIISVITNVCNKIWNSGE